MTNALSKKIENHTAAVALHTMFYNFVRVHQTLKISSAMAAGVTDRLWEMSDIVAVLEAWEAEHITEPSLDVEANKIGEGHFVRIAFPNGVSDVVYGFATKADAVKWIRCEAVVWLWQHRTGSNKKAAS